MKKSGLLIVIFCLLEINPAWAQDALTWEDCVHEAKENNPDLISAAEEIRQARRDLEIELSAILPQITTDASGRRGKSASAKTDYSYTYSLTGEQLVFDGFKTSSEVSNAFKTIKAQEYNYAVVSSNIRLDLRSAFVELLKAQDLMPIVVDIAVRRKQNMELVRLRYEAGREHRGSLLTAEADLAQSEFEVSQARRDIPLAQRRLAKELGRDSKKGLNAQGDFSLNGEYGFVPDIENLVFATPFLRELIAKKESVRYSLLSEESYFLK